MADIMDYMKTVMSIDLNRDSTKRKRPPQFNVEIEPGLADMVRSLAKTLKVPNYAACEHIIQVGIYSTLRAMQKKEKAEKITDHITNRHLLKLPDDDEDAVILMSEDNNNWILLKGAKDVLNSYERLKNAMTVAEETEDPAIMSKAKRNLDKAAVLFASQIIELNRNPLKNIKDIPGFQSGDMDDKE